MAYPKYIAGNLGPLADFLLAPPEKEELDANGCFSRQACNSVDQMLLNDLGGRMKGFYMPADPPRGTDPNNRWRTVSCLQKAIRFGDVEMAKFAASAAFDMDRKYLFRRLGICAIEDVGVGNLYALLATLAALGSASWRAAVDERRLACFLAELLASGAKDRAACELLVIVDFNKDLPKADMGKWPSEKLMATALSDALGYPERMCATWLLAGTKKFWGETMPKGNDRPATGLFRMMVNDGMSRAMLYAAAKVASRLNEGMFTSLFFIDRWLRATKRASIETTPMPRMDKVGKLLGAAYDMHTREGRVALGKFRKEQAAALQPFISQVDVGKEENLLWFGTFVAEGGLLNRKIVYENARMLRATAFEVELSYSGLPAELHRPFVDFMQSNLEKLNECRSKVLWAQAKSKQSA